MREIPECLNRRYKALDELIKELSTAMSQGGPLEQQPSNENDNMGIKLMCDFWNILKDDPDCNLKEEVRQCMGVESKQSASLFGSHRSDVADKYEKQDKNVEYRRRDPTNRIIHIFCEKDPKVSKKPCCGNRPMSKTSSVVSDKMPLSKVLCNLKEAASFDKKCNVRVGELMAAQRDLTDQIQILEQREKEGAKLLKQADCMWSCMEDAYKKKVAESLERQKILLKELKEVETSSNKWRKNKKDIEFQLSGLNKTKEDITEKINQKSNDIKVMDMEIADLKKRIESNVEDSEMAKISLSQTKDASDNKMAALATEMVKLQKKVEEQQNIKTEKVQEGTTYVKDAREDLQKICRVLLQKKLENEDLQAEKEALIQETELLNNTCETCKEKCKNKEISVAEQIKKLDDEIAEHKNKCIRCHECTDTIDVRKFCTDCPRCIAERDCLYEGNHCSPDHTMDCVCMSVKQKFLDNVFDNMYTVLERQSKTSPGKAVADAVLNCLKRSRNGKLNEGTRKILQDFILTTVKKNLNLTIVGGAVKTRCEMDPETYTQLMLCLKEVNATRPIKTDKGTGAKKEPCRRWGGPSECNCPKGPKACICTKKAPPPPKDPTPCGPPDKEDAGEAKACPHKKDACCGPDCGMQGARPNSPDVAAWRPDPCRGANCAFSSNMRAAQCVLGPEPLAAVTKAQPAPKVLPDSIDLKKMATCTCEDKTMTPCSCGDTKHLKAEVKENCDKSTCPMNWKATIGDNLLELPLDDVLNAEPRVASIPSVQKDVLSQGLNQEQTLSDLNIENKQPSPYKTKEQFKIAIENQNGEISNQLTELTETNSGTLAMELEEHIVELIEEKSKTKPYLYVSLKTTDSGHMLVGFDTEDNVVSATQRVTVRRTPSGTKLIDIHKDFIQKLKTTTSNEKNESNLSKNVKLPSSPKKHGSPNRDIIKAAPSFDSIKETNWKPEQKRRNDIIKAHKKVENITDTQIPIHKFVDEDHSVSRESKDVSLTTLSWNSGTSPVEKHSLPSGYSTSRPGSAPRKPAASDTKKPKKIMQEKDVYDPPLIITQTESQEADVNGQEECDCPPTPPILFDWKPSVFVRTPLTQTDTRQEENRTPSLTQTDTRETENKTPSLTQTDTRETENRIPSLTQTDTRETENKTPSLTQTDTRETENKTPSLTQTDTTETENIIPSITQTETENLTPPLTKTDTRETESSKKNPIQVIVKVPEKVTQVKAPINIKSKEYDCVCPRVMPPPCCKPVVTNKKAQLKEKTAPLKDNSLKEIKTECQCTQNSRTSSFKSATSISYTSLADTDYIPELTDLYKQGNVNVVVKVRSRNGIVRKLDTVVTRTTSGTLAIHAKDMATLGNITFVEDEYPVLLTKTVSDTYFVGIGQYDRTLNAFLRKTKSGGMLVVPRSKSSEIQSHRNQFAHEEFFKIKVTGVRNYPVELPAVLKKTLSDNYIILLDKEFEKRYKQTVQEFVGENRECFVDLTKSSSGYYIIHLDTEEESHLTKRNALLVKSLSGNIKVLVHGPEFDSMVKSVSKKSSTLSSKAFGQLVRKLPASSREFHREHLRKSKFLDKKASSDTQLYEKVRMQLQDRKHLLSEPSALLKKTASGQYAIILNKESKKAFINNLQSYLTSNSHGLIPIKRTESGEIVIILNSRNEAKGRYGSLKITASGNIFVMIDEKTLKGITKNDKKKDAAGVVVASSMATDTINPNAVNKSVTTTCNATLADCSCDTSKCVCAELELNALDWFDNDSVKNMYSVLNKPAEDANCCAENQCLIANGGKLRDTPHIVIKPACDCEPPTVKKLGSTEQCFYLFDTICPYHKDRYDSVSNELLEITGLCTKKQEELKNKFEFKVKTDSSNIVSGYGGYHTWDSLNYLPPQLPPFLKNVSYR